ncbi:MAG: ATP-binding protein [Alcanivoracaceae bacterium]|nr:ATP-binding protein [Alcanivoracaceae bacterium]
MYSFLPAIISVIFLTLGFYVVKRKGLTRVSSSFLFLCVTTFFWQATWAVLYQVKDPDIANFLVKLGYFFILFLPTSIYQFLSEISNSRNERRYVHASYAVACGLAAVMLTTNLFVNGYYEYSWGFYPKAGVLHFVHVLQTAVVVCRGLYITWLEEREAHHFQQARLRSCVVGMLIYFFASLDYLCNYGVDFYPPGVIFILISFSIMTVAIVKYGLMDNPASIAATIAHEMRTPLATIQLQAQSIGKYLPELFKGYQLAVDNQLCAQGIKTHHFEKIRDIAAHIETEVRQSNAIIDITLASAHRDLHKYYDYSVHSMAITIIDAVDNYPFNPGERDNIELDIEHDFIYLGSDTLMKYVVYNLIKNALFAIKAEGKGGVRLALERHGSQNRMTFVDTGPGIPADIVPHVFEEFFTTKREGSGSGMGLAFCKRVISSFQGSILCHSRHGEFTSFVLTFPALQEGEGRAFGYEGAAQVAQS